MIEVFMYVFDVYNTSTYFLGISATPRRRLVLSDVR